VKFVLKLVSKDNGATGDDFMVCKFMDEGKD